MSLTPAQVGPYCLPSDVINVLNPLGAPPAPGSPAALPVGIIADLIADAQTTIDSWLADKYEVPFAIGNVPDQVAKLTRDLGSYLCTLAAYGGEALPSGHPAILRYTAVMTALQALAAGRMTLARPATDTATTRAQQTAAGPTVVNPYNGSMFTLEGAGIGPARWPYGRF